MIINKVEEEAALDPRFEEEDDGEEAMVESPEKLLDLEREKNLSALIPRQTL